MRTPPAKPPIALVRQGFEDAEPVAWACGVCGTVRGSQADARECYRCTEAVCACGEVSSRGWTACDACRAKTRAKAARMKSRDAKALTVSEWTATCADGEMVTDGESFWPSPDYLCPDELDGLPVDSDGRRYLWATHFVRIHIDPDDTAADLMERATEEHHEHIGEDLDGAVLREALEKWNQEHTAVGSWFQDDTRRIIIPFDWLYDEDADDE